VIDGLELKTNTSPPEDFVCSIEVEFGPILGQRSSREDKDVFYTFYTAPMRRKCLFYPKTVQPAASAIFQADGVPQTSAVRPSLFSRGVIRLLQPQILLKGEEKPEWNFERISKIKMALSVEFALE
jgi:hypothetical protein